MGIGTGIVLGVLGLILLTGTIQVDLPFIEDYTLGWILVVAAIVAVNAVGDIIDPDTGRIVAGVRGAGNTFADARTIVLTGRSFGTTNLVLLDADGNAIVDERILVSIDEGNTVRVFRQTDRSVLSCTPNCEEHSSRADTGG